jgi:hypothetical protein
MHGVVRGSRSTSAEPRWSRVRELSYIFHVWGARCYYDKRILVAIHTHKKLLSCKSVEPLCPSVELP